VMNTYLLYCRFQKMRGGFTENEYEREMALVRETLGALDEPHWREYLAAWPGAPAVEPAPPEPVPAAASEQVSTSIYIEASSIRT
jgi:hypothetical protein